MMIKSRNDDYNQGFGKHRERDDVGGDYDDRPSKIRRTSSVITDLPEVSLASTHITDRGLEALAKFCPSIERVNLSRCRSITDSGISFLLQNCRELRTLYIESCSSITGIGFLECPKTLTDLEAGGCKLTPEGINAIVSGGGIESLCLSTREDELAEVGEGSINTEAVMMISKGCPLLKNLFLSNCEEVELQGWEAIGRNCKYLELLNVYGCIKLCDSGLQALCNGCDKLESLFIDDENSCSAPALEDFKRKKPGVLIHLHDIYAEMIMSEMKNVKKDKTEE